MAIEGDSVEAGDPDAVVQTAPDDVSTARSDVFRGA